MIFGCLLRQYSHHSPAFSPKSSFKFQPNINNCRVLNVKTRNHPVTLFSLLPSLVIRPFGILLMSPDSGTFLVTQNSTPDMFVLGTVVARIFIRCTFFSEFASPELSSSKSSSKEFS